MKKWVLVLSVVLSFDAVAGNSLCEVDNTTCFECGSTCRAKLTFADNEKGQPVGTLTISGTGAMDNYGYKEQADANGDYYSRPYYGIEGQVQNIKIEEGITTVGTNAFINFYNLQNVELPDSLTGIFGGGFQSCSSLENINIPNKITTIGQQAFENTKLSSFVVPENTSLDRYSFSMYNTQTKLNTIYCNTTNLTACQNAVAYRGDNIEIIKYEKLPNNQYLMKGKYYQTLNDINSGHYIQKRIYTIEEANAIAKPSGNTVRIKYR